MSWWNAKKDYIIPVSIEFVSEDNSSPGPSSLRFASVRNRYAVPGMFEELEKRPTASLKRVSIPTIPQSELEHPPNKEESLQKKIIGPTILSIKGPPPPPPPPPLSLESDTDSFKTISGNIDSAQDLSRRGSSHLPQKFVRRNSSKLLELEPLGYENNDGWKTHTDFLFSCFALSLGLSNIWRLSSHARDRGAYVFIWFLIMFLVGYPLLFLELSLTYFSNKGPIRLWNAVPILKGVGFLQLFISYLYCMYIPAISSYAFFYTSIGLKSGTWDNCQSSSSKLTVDVCVARNELVSHFASPGETCFINEVAEWKDLSHFSFNFYLIPGAILMYLLAFVSVFRGTQTLKRVFWTSSSITFVLLIAFLAYGLSYGDAYEYGLLELFDASHWNKSIQDLDLWLSAFCQVLLTMHLSCGVFISLGSRTKRYGKYVTLDTTLIFFANLIIGLLCIIMTNAWMGVTRKGSIKDPIYNTSFLLGLFYDISIVTEKEANRYLILSLFAILTFSSSISSLAPIVFTLTSTIDEHVYSSRKRKFIKVSLLIFSLAGTLMLLSSFGLPLIYILDNFVIVGLVFIAALFFIIGFVFVYGRSHRLESDFIFWTNNDLGIMKILIKMLGTVVPFILIIGLIMFIVTLSLKTVCCINDIWEVGLIWGFFAFGLFIILFCALREISVQIDYGIINRLKSATKCDLDWGPMDPILQHQWHDYMRYEKNQPFAKLYHNVDKTGIVNLNFSDESSTKF
ncbi:sodium- and chloride-dependent GABA transporter 1 isoform X1 [Lepeophtheirus salmonis]|uniref:sodium- and chloride-dependent GABA transporter 1 isoform X1 n=2 Tax=Lepeophtheirus salmonis TaxID=72036 RepID=UPI001AE7D549|nr:sodium- and chloride-dependent neutral and basic amino acid transporter B(0+)-like isoform X1 [Lepeophtheirus salmonis]